MLKKLNIARKRGFILTTDALLAFFLTIVIILSTNFFIARTEEQLWTKYHVIKSSQDTIAVLDYNSTLQTATPEQIQEILDVTDPDTTTYIDIDCEGKHAYVGKAISDKKFVFSDDYVFIKMGSSEIKEICLAKYQISVK